MTVWFTADLHVGHQRVVELRGFADTVEHDLRIAANWIKTVDVDDQVWVLGDLALSQWTRALAMVRSLPGDKHLILGNHDRGHPMHRDGHKHQGPYLETFTSVQTMARRRIPGTRDSMMLSHFPYSGDHTEGERYTQYRLRDEGLPLLHGHTHMRGKVTRSELNTPQIHVGLDAWDLTPVSLEEVVALLAQ